jgi:GNAT superfamily N-acetyltransferase
MKIEAIRELYDRHERRFVALPGYTREEGEHTVRMIDSLGQHGYVAWSEVGAENADAAIQGELARFAALGRGFEWKYYDHDGPADLLERLAGHGFELDEVEAIMALDLEEAQKSPPPPPGLELRKLVTPEELGPLASVEEAVWQEDPSPIIESLAQRLRDAPLSTSVYLALMDGLPVSAAWISFPEASPFASLWGGSTLEAWRGRGVYTALLGQRMAEAKARGYRFLTIDASPMSRAIVEKKGFRLLALSRPCNFKPQGLD